MRMIHEQSVRWCLNNLFPPSWHPYPLEHLLPSSNFHRQAHTGKSQRQSEQVESFRYIWQSDTKKDINKNLVREKWKYSLRQWNLSTWHSYPIPLQSLPTLNRPETRGSFVNKVHGEQAAHLWTRSYLRHGPVLVLTVTRSNVVEATANRHMLIRRRNCICVMLSW